MSYSYALSGEQSGLKFITGNTIRATFAIPMDQRIAETLRHPSDANEDVTASDDVDADRVALHTGRHAYLLAGKEAEWNHGSGSFRYEYRINSWPIPEVVGAGASAQNGVLSNDGTPILNSVKRRMQKLSRLKRGGTVEIPSISPTWRLGMSVGGISYSGGVWPIRSVVTGITWENTPGRQYTILRFG
jgi:hypothetical protein